MCTGLSLTRSAEQGGNRAAMGQTNAQNARSLPSPTRAVVCEDCATVRACSEAGWVRLWLDEKYQAPVMLIYCPPCARLFDA